MAKNLDLENFEVEYIDLIKNKTLVKSFKNFKAKNWRALQEFLGNELNVSQQFFYILKLKNNDKLFKGQIRSIAGNDATPVEKKSNEVLSEINSLRESLKGLNNGVTTELLISITKQSYETQINFLNQELVRKENYINKLESEINNLENELDQVEPQTDLTKYIEIAQTFLKLKQGGLKEVVSLEASNTSDIPEEILTILGLVDYSRIPQTDLNQIISYLKIFIQKLPLKG